MKTHQRIIAISFFTASVFLINFLGGCKKENTVPPIRQATLATNNIHGLLDGEEITVQNNASYFTDASNTDSSLTGILHHTDQHDEDEDLDDKSMLVTGCQWHTTDHAGNNVTTGTIQVHKEVFRIYVTPFLSSTTYYGMVQPGIYTFAYHNNNKNGAFLSMMDKSGVLWTSKGDQTGSSFQITTRGANQQTYTTIEGTATCKMYNAQGSVKTFTGTFSAITGL